ncbi:hypothetical protein MTBBW1_1680040 [Desulfamplus magnetovallimortis]|uniref:Uncharacterized protein n=1 Tax=Desulfamplus magnetovallimortis TaxID=1246637 RepID=A0A1W1H9S9_9BACT|nr:hypothetical protein MTBBW1_1680040 [Desulfamplus magnetovallimortis]
MGMIDAQPCPFINITTCEVRGIGEKRLSWIHEKEDFSPVKLAELIAQGESSLTSSICVTHQPLQVP